MSGPGTHLGYITVLPFYFPKGVVGGAGSLLSHGLKLFFRTPHILNHRVTPPPWFLKPLEEYDGLFSAK